MLSTSTKQTGNVNYKLHDCTLQAKVQLSANFYKAPLNTHTGLFLEHTTEQIISKNWQKTKKQAESK